MKKIFVCRFCIVTILCFLSAFSLQAQKLIDKAEQVFEGVKMVVVDGSFCNVSINGEARENTDFKGEIRGRLYRKADIKIQYKQEGEILHVWIDRPNSISGNMESLLKFKVPHSTIVEVGNSSGDIEVYGIKSQKIKLFASSGDISLDNSKCDIKFKTSSGDVEITEHEGLIEGRSISGDQSYVNIVGDVITESTSGDLEFNTVKGDVESKTTSGDVEFISVSGNVSNQSSSGEIMLKHCKGAFQLRTTSGDIQGDGVLLLNNSRFRTSSGDIYFNLQNDMEALSFDLQATSGNLRVGNRRAEKEMVLNYGDISVYGKSTSGSQFYH